MDIGSLGFDVFGTLEQKMPLDVVRKIKLFCYDSIIIRNSRLKYDIAERSVEIHTFGYRMNQAKKYCRMKVRHRQKQKVKELMERKKKRMMYMMPKKNHS